MRSYVVEVSAELAERYGDWTRIDEIPAPLWFKVVPHEDGTAEVWLNSGEDRPKDLA